MLRAALTRLGGWMPPRAARRPPPATTTRAFASNRSKGIYAGKDIRFGNNISFSHRKTPRTLKSTRDSCKRLWSETLGCWLRFNLTTHALRCIDRAGGIDAYLLKALLRRWLLVDHGRERYAAMIEAARSGSTCQQTSG